jgi:hypothetical protein
MVVSAQAVTVTKLARTAAAATPEEARASILDFMSRLHAVLIFSDPFTPGSNLHDDRFFCLQEGPSSEHHASCSSTAG